MKERQAAQTQYKQPESELLDDIVKVPMRDLRQNKKVLSDFFTGVKAELCHIKADILRESDIDKYFTQLATYLANNESLAKCFDSMEGKLSLIGGAVREAVEIGVLPGVDADIVAYKQSIWDAQSRSYKEVYIADLQPSAEAYEAICLAEPNPVFSQVKTGVVYEKDASTTKIQPGLDGKIEQHVSLLPDRGEIVGVWIECLPPIGSDKKTVVDYWSITRIIKIRDQYSPSWKKYKTDLQEYADCESGKIKNAEKQANGNYKIPGAGWKGKDKWVNNPEKSDPVWLTNPELMAEKTIRKGVLKRFAKVKRAMSRLLILDDNQQEQSGAIHAGIIRPDAPIEEKSMAFLNQNQVHDNNNGLTEDDIRGFEETEARELEALQEQEPEF